MACGDPKAAAQVAILDPLLTVSQPPRVTACTGIDALAHALETAVTKKRTALSAMFLSRGVPTLLNRSGTGAAPA
jgi:alcohol dehydrogenase